MNVSLTAELEAQVQSMVESGRFASQSEVVRAALRLLVDQEAKLAALRAEIQKGIDDVEAGRVVSITREELIAAVNARASEILGQDSPPAEAS